MIEIADSWQGRDGSPIVSIPVDSFEAGDLIVVYSFAFGGSPGVPTDDGGNVYTVRTQTTADGTFDSVVSISDAIVDTVPTQVEVTNTAGGANDTGIVVLRVTHNGTGWTSSNYVLSGTVTGTGPTTGEVTVGDATPAPFADEGAALYVAGLTHDGATTTFTAGTGWATVEEEEDASLIPYSVVSKVEIASGPQTHQWAVGASRDFAYVIAAYTENIPDPVLELVTVAPVPSVTGLGITVSNPGRFPDPDLHTFFVLVHPEGDGLYVPTLQNAELLRVTAWDALTMPPEDWTIERAQADSLSQNVEVGWWVWWDHLFSDPLELLDYVASYQLTQVAGGIGGVAEDIEDIETEVETIGDDVDAVEADMDAVEVLVEKLRVIARTVYTSGSGTHTYDDDMASVQFIVCGGGGAGGDAPDDGIGSTAGSGGGGGGVAQKMVIRTGEASCTYTVGAAGSGSTVSHGALTLSGNAGSSGVNGISSPSAHAGGAGGTATGGDMNSKGQAGSPSISIGDQHAMSGNGGSSVMGGGGVGGVTTSAGGGANGGAGGNYGGGGGGGCAGGSTTRVGGAGAAGIIIIEEYGIGV